MLNIQVKSKELRKKEGTSKQGKPYCFYVQTVWVHLPDEPYPSKVEISHNSESDAYPFGDYTLAPSSIYVDRFQNLAIKPVLHRIAPPVQAAANAKG